MSAIWGCIDLSGNPIESKISEKMSECTKKYRIDKTTEVLVNNVYMACGLQYITKESYSERLPFNEQGIYFTADCILDDRQKLVGELTASYPEVSEDTPDGELLFKAFLLWGDHFADHVTGLFAFAVYDSNKNEFNLYTDHTCQRCIHYHIRDNRVYFATLTDSIVNTLTDIKVSEQFMIAAQAVDVSFIYLFEGLSPFENVYMLPYGTGLTVKKVKGVLTQKTARYWEPLKNVKRDGKFDEEKYRREFVETHIACVRDAIRTDGNIGCTLSSGLDSTSVASVAATFLAEKGKELYSFTSVPVKEFRENNNDKGRYYINDESEGVKKFCEKFPNIRPSFLACENESPWTYLEMWNDIIEIPGKFYVNGTWLYDSMKLAGEKMCKVLLSGAAGNNTISFGSVENTVFYLLRRFRFGKALEQFNAFTKKERINRRKYLKYLFRCISTKKDYLNLFDGRAFKRELIERFNTGSSWKRLFRSWGGMIKSPQEHAASVISPSYFQMIGVWNTKFGLYTGVIPRDPTMDKRMLELCLRMPYLSFAWNGVNRRLVREYLKDIVPDEIRLVTRHRGRQSGDITLRMDRYVFPDGKKPWDKITPVIDRYYDRAKVIEKLKTPCEDADVDWRIKVVSCSLFLEKYAKNMG